MIYLLDTSTPLSECAEELQVDRNHVGQLLTPLTRFTNRSPGRFAIDNGAFAGFNINSFRSLLAREQGNKDGCMFVVAPDVVGDARRTLELFSHWYPRLHGWPIALACQNGQEHLEIPWKLIDAVFIGGDDKFKTSDAARAIVRCAKAMEKWTHVGRVNGPVRLDVMIEWGVDSIDGTGLSRYTKMRTSIADYQANEKLPGLTGGVSSVSAVGEIDDGRDE